MNFYELALEINEETVKHRRFFHENAETGLDTSLAIGYIKSELEKCGITPIDCGHGVSAVIGRSGNTILLRADMDALDIPEESGEPFACKNGMAHACGHDLHAAMLLSSAKILKRHEDSLCGRVKLMFQPAEETLEGCNDMVENMILEDPKVLAAVSFHVTSGRIPIGTLMYNSGKVMMNSADVFKIEIFGRGGHGAYPNLAVDPLIAASYICMALSSLPGREASPDASCALTIGRFSSGKNPNVIPETAILEGALRTDDANARKHLVKRIYGITDGIAKSFGCTSKLTMRAQVPALVCDSALTDEAVSYITQVLPETNVIPNMKASASEDFAVIAQRVPSTMIYLSAGFLDERGDYAQHNPRVRFNEEALPIGTAAYAAVAWNWLKNHSE